MSTCCPYQSSNAQFSSTFTLSPFTFLLSYPVVPHPFSSVFSICMISLCLSLMNDFFNTKEYGWIENSDSDINSDPLADDSDTNSRTSVEFEVPFARHGPIIKVDPSNLSSQRDFWGNCVIGYIIDNRNFLFGIFNMFFNLHDVLREWCKWLEGNLISTSCILLTQRTLTVCATKALGQWMVLCLLWKNGGQTLF